MKEYLANKIQYWRANGLCLPFAFDAANGKPSVTVLFAYLTFCLAAGSVIALHFFPKVFTATCVSIVFWAMATVFYMVRKLHKASFDLKNQSLALESEDDDKAPPAQS